MTPNEYVENALRTESKIEKLDINSIMVVQLLRIIFAAGSMLDQVKKNTFYNKPFNVETFDQYKNIIENGLWFFREIDGVKHPTTSKSNLQKEGVSIDPRVFHGIIGMITESAELAEALVKMFNGTTDTTNLLEEVGDIAWYQAILVDSLNGNMEQVLERNIAKLKARFPNKFTSEDAINRNLDKERAILEGK